MSTFASSRSATAVSAVMRAAFLSLPSIATHGAQRVSVRALVVDDMRDLDVRQTLLQPREVGVVIAAVFLARFIFG